MYCLNCGKEISDGIAFCPYCGKPQEQPQEKENILAENISEPVPRPPNHDNGEWAQELTKRKISLKRIIIPVVFLLLAVTASVLGALQLMGKGVVSWPPKLGTTFNANAYTYDVSGIIHYMQKKHGRNVMKHSQLYALKEGSFGYVMQMQDGNEVEYSFLMPYASESWSQALQKDSLYYESSDAGVNYIIRGMEWTDPVPVDSTETVTINGKELFLSRITVDEFPEYYNGFPVTMYIVTDNNERIRRFIIMGVDGIVGRSDFTYDENGRIVKSHWTSILMEASQWEEMGWFSFTDRKMRVTVEDIDAYLREAIVKMPKDFIASSPSGKEDEINTIYSYDGQGNLINSNIDYGNGKLIWDFNYENGKRVGGYKSYDDQYIVTIPYTYERDEKGLINKIGFVDDLPISDGSDGYPAGEIIEINFSYDKDGYMEAQPVIK